jgi:putative phosphoribosyl transferase
MTFIDRVEAGRRLARLVGHLGGPDLVVLGLPRGGVPVALEVARELRAPLDVIVVRKLGVPGEPELAMGAIGEGGVRLLDDHVLRAAGVGPDEVEQVEEQEWDVLARRVRELRGDRPAEPLAGRTALIVDDGVATGSTARAACRVARARGARRVVLAVPVADEDAVDLLSGDADEVVTVLRPERLWSISQWYDDFSPTTDAEVRELLRRAAGSAAPTGRDEEVLVRAGRLELPGHLTVAGGATGVVVFVHGSGSSRHSPRNQSVAATLREAGLGTLLFDLLTPAEESDRGNVFDIPLLAERLAAATLWLRTEVLDRELPIGWFGASTGAGAALWAAADPQADVSAIVSRGGRPDLAGSRLAAVRAPTRLIVGSRDAVVVELNREAQARLHCPNDLIIVPGATHLFEEPGTLAMAAAAASDWFGRHLRPLSHYGAAHASGASTVEYQHKGMLNEKG